MYNGINATVVSADDSKKDENDDKPKAIKMNFGPDINFQMKSDTHIRKWFSNQTVTFLSKRNFHIISQFSNQETAYQERVNGL